MAFKLEEGVESNIFDGPMALTKGRDACGVGFIANTQSGGTSSLFVTPASDVFSPLVLFRIIDSYLYVF